MRILFATGSSPRYMAPPMLAEEQVVCGPDFPDAVDSSGRFLSLKTPLGQYDLSRVAARLPAAQRPDVVVCLVDASWRSEPRNLSAFPCPRVLLVADTHHLTSPIVSMLRYAMAEPFTRVGFLYNWHHAGIFRSAGLRNLYWLPGFTFPHGDAEVRAARARRRESHLAFVGQAGRLHPRRERLLGALAAGGIPVAQRSLAQPEALRFYGASLAAFNASLNGDLNLRVFEAIAAGALLFTDHLAPAAGLDHLFADGREIVTYRRAEELVERSHYLMARPTEARAIAEVGQRWFDKCLSETVRRAAFARVVFDGVASPPFDLDPFEPHRPLFGGDVDRVLRAAAAYEEVQELHRHQETVSIWIDPQSSSDDVRTLCTTLPRVVFTGRCDAQADVAVFAHDRMAAVPLGAAARLWCHDGDPALIIERLAEEGFTRCNNAGLYRRTRAPRTGCQSPASDRRTILFYSDEPNPHGVAQYNHSILLALADAGWRVVSAHPKFDSPMIEAQQAAGIRHIWTTWNWGQYFVRSMTDTAEPERIVDEVRPDVVFFSDCWPISNIAAKHVVIARQLPFLVVCHSGDAGLARNFPSALKVVALQMAKARQVIAVAANSLDVLRRTYGLTADKGIVVYNGRPACYFRPPNPVARARLRAEIGVPEDGVLCLTAARFDVAKGYQFQLEALQRLGDDVRRGRLHFAWAGSGELKAEAEMLVARLGLESHVHFLGHRNDIADWMDAADIFVLTTMKEAMPLAVMEAMAKGLPVAATSVGGIPEEIGEAGQLLPDPNGDPVGTVTALASTLTAWAGDSARRRSFGDAARVRASSLFREEAMVARTLALIDDAASAASVRPAGRIVVKLQGGLGNQMFQYAAGRAMARRTGAKLSLDLGFLRDRRPRANFTFRDYCLDLFELPRDCDVLEDGSAFAATLPARRERHFHFDPGVMEWGADGYLDGYFQSPRYFATIEPEIRQTFTTFRAELTPSQRALAERITACPAVCLNVRRGDYVANPVTNAFHGVCDVNYFRRAVAMMRERVPDAHFFVFSDDIEWCRGANLTDGAPTTLCSHGEYAGDRFGAYLHLMMQCRHFIIPNSSFGWWAAFLSRSPDKIVITPAPWFDDPRNDTKDLLPEGWIRLPKDGSSPALPAAAGPAVTVVVLCHNYAQYLAEAVGSVLAQTWRDFEIVILDDGSTDGSLALAQRLAVEHAARAPIRVYHLDDVGPTAARRFGVGQSRGRYVLMLDADDKLQPQFLGRTIPVLDANPRLGYVYTQIESVGEAAPPWRLQRYDFALLCRQNNAPYCSLIRKAAYNAVGGHDTENWGYYEDWDLWLRLGKKGWVGELIDEPLFQYRRHFSSSLSQFGTRLDAVYKAFIVTRHAENYTSETVRWAKQTLSEMPGGWHKRPPLRRAEEIEPLLVAYPGNRHLLYLLALSLAREQRPIEAAEALRELLSKHPSDNQARDLLVRLDSAAADGSNGDRVGVTATENVSRKSADSLEVTTA